MQPITKKVPDRTRFPENPVSMNDDLTNHNTGLYFHDKALVKNTRLVLNEVVQEYIRSHGINFNPAHDVQAVGSGANGTVYKINSLDLAVSIMADMISNGVGVMFGFTKGSLPKVEIAYVPGSSYASMLKMIKHAMTEHAVKMMWKSRKSQKGGNDDPMLAVKVQIIDEAETVQDVRHENAVHAMLANTEGLSHLVPSMYAAATLRVPISGEALKALLRVRSFYAGKPNLAVAVRVTFMQFMAPVYQPLDFFVHKDAKVQKSIVARKNLYGKVRDAFIDLWAAGFAHGDAHAKNIVVNNKTKSVCFYDFGFTVKLEDQVRQMCVNLKEARAGGASNQDLDSQLNQCMAAVHQNLTLALKRRYSWANFCNSDVNLIKSMRAWIDKPTERVVAYNVLAPSLPDELRQFKATLDSFAVAQGPWFLDKNTRKSSAASKTKKTAKSPSTKASDSKTNSSTETKPKRGRKPKTTRGSNSPKSSAPKVTRTRKGKTNALAKKISSHKSP